jgi:hypothetical protein
LDPEGRVESKRDLNSGLRLSEVKELEKEKRIIPADRKDNKKIITTVVTNDLMKLIKDK